MQVRERADLLAAAGATAIAVGFSPPDALAELAAYLDWPFPFLSDPERLVFGRLGFPVVGRAQVWTPGTKAIYRRAAEEGARVRKAVEDTSQLGGDAVIGWGAVLELFPTDGPDDRVPIEDLLAAVARHRRTP